MRRSSLLPLLAVAFLAAAPGRALAADAGTICPLTPLTRSCGAEVLQRAFENLRHATDPRAAAALTRLMEHAASAHGLNSLLEIKEAAEAAGLRTAALKVNLDGLRRLLHEGEVIANITGNMHFSLITGADGQSVSIYDPGLSFSTPAMPATTFRNAWDGRLLVVSGTPLDLASLGVAATALSDAELNSILGGQPCQNCAFGSTSKTNGADPEQNARTTREPVQLRNGNLFLDVEDVTMPTRGLPLNLTRHYNAQTVSEVVGWTPEPAAGTWVIENGEYSGEGDRSLSDVTGQDVTVSLDMQTIQPGTETWEVGWVNVRYTASSTNPRDAYNGYYFLIHTNGTLELSKWQNGAQYFLFTKLSAYSPTNKNHVTMQAQGANIKVYVNGALEINYTDANPLLSAGRIALEAHLAHVHFDNVSITTGTGTTTYDFSNDDNEFIFGYGWTHAYGLRLREYPTHVTLIRENNSRETYLPQVNGTYAPSPHNYYKTLTKDATGFSLRTTHGLHYRFDLAGRLQYIEDRNLNRTTLTYATVSSQIRLTQITEPAGRSLSLQYGPNNMVSSVTDPAGNQTTYTYDAAGHLVAVRDRVGSQESYAYDPITHNLIRLTDKEGHVFQYTYTYNDRLKTQTDPLGNVTTFDYLWDTTHVINSRNQIYKYNFDANLFVQSIADPNNVMERFANDADGNVTIRYDRNGAMTSMAYDAKGNRTDVTDPLLHLTHTTYEPTYNLPTSVTDARGNVTTFSYDARGNLLQTTNALGGVTTYTYNGAGQVLTARDPRGNTTTFTYDTYGNLASVTDPLGNTVTYTYDILGRRLTVADALGTVGRYTYDANGQLLSATDALNRATTYAYTPNGRLSSVRDPLGQTTTTTYDGFGNVLTVTDPLGRVSRFTYDTVNQMHLDRANRLTVTDPNAYTTAYAYDALDRLVSVTDAASNITRFTYDLQGNRISRTDALSRTTAYGYDPLNRLVSITYPDASRITYTLDPVGNLAGLSDATGTTSYTYDALNRLTRKVFPDLTTFDYTYDSNGNRTALAITGAGTISYTYDALNRLTQLTAPSGAITRFTYDQRSRRTQLVYPNGVTTTYGYDLLNQPTSISAQTSTAQVVSLYYGYDALERRAYLYRYAPSGNDYLYDTYDPASQLTKEWGSLSGASTTTLYAYDAAGNRTSLNVNGAVTTSTYNALNQLTAASAVTPSAITVSGPVSDANLSTVNVNGVPAQVSAGRFTAANVPLALGPNTLTVSASDKAGNVSTHTVQVTYSPTPVTTTYTYDLNGNRTQKSSPSGTETLTYDFDNRLKTFAAGSTSATYTYNGLGERVAKTVNGLTTKSYLDGPEVVFEVTGATSTFYLHGPAIDGLLASYVGTTPTFYHQDALGSVVALTDGAGAVIRQTGYEPFGGLRGSSGIASPWSFTGRYLDQESGLVFLRNRYYDAGTGRFLTQDPIGIAGGVNLYAYVRNNPLNSIDPLGFSGTLEIQVERGDGTLLSGHAWIAFTSDQTGQRHTYGTWGRSDLGLVGVETDVELNWTGGVSRATHITDQQEWTLQYYIGSQQALGKQAWGPICNCSEFAQEAWNRTTGERLNNSNGFGIPNPNSLADSIMQANSDQPHGTLDRSKAK